MQTIAGLREPLHIELRAEERITAGWPELLAYHREQGHRSLYLLPLVFGQRTIGFVGLGFKAHEPLQSELAELLIALGQQVTLALAMKRLFNSAKQAAVLAERNRIGREIHDGLAQAFTGILMQLGAAEELSEGSPITPVMNRIRDIAKEGLTEARRSVLALRPDEPRAGGLELALRQLAERSIVAGRIATRFQGGGATGLPPEHEHALLRIAQEAVINAVRHAQPRNIEIHLDQDGEELRLRIRDDGKGLWQLPEISALQGFGLTNMRERAEDMGGRLSIESEPDAGTAVTVRVPRSARAR
jgi:signal transduction histidine kinase